MVHPIVLEAGEKSICTRATRWWEATQERPKTVLWTLSSHARDKPQPLLFLVRIGIRTLG